MKSLAIYAAAAVFTTAFATLFSWFLSTSEHETDLAVQKPAFAMDDVRYAVDRVLAEQEASRLATADPESSELLKSVDRRIDGLRQEQQALVKDLRELARGGARGPGGDYVIPDEARIQELVAEAVLRKREEEELARREREIQRDQERADRRKRETIDRMARVIGGDPGRAERVVAVLDRIKGENRDYVSSLRRTGQTLDRQQIRDHFSAVMGRADDEVRAILTSDEFDRYLKYRDKHFALERRSLEREMKAR